MSSSSYEPEDDAPDYQSETEEIARIFYDSSDAGPSSRQLQHLTLTSSPPPLQRKRKRVEKWAWNKRENHIRRANALHISSYKDLLLEVTDGATKEPDHEAVIHSSQFGIVMWSADEKLALFTALARKGKGAVSEIASVIGTKSRIEVQQFLIELQRALQQQYITDKNFRGITFSDIHAAAEISEECCLALEKAANALSVQEEQAHNLSGRRKYKDMWLVDSNAAAYLEEKIQTKDISDVDASAHHMLATAQLFHVPNWINLSRNVFMNFGGHRIEDNWTKICFHEETPAVTCDSFTDFYTIAVSLTRRLVQSSIFFALMRIRGMDERGRDRDRVIRRDDVLSALDTLKVRHNTREFWIHAARRCSLDVREYVSKSSFKTTILSYDEVEKRLSAPSLELPEPHQGEDEVQEEPSEEDTDILPKNTPENYAAEESSSSFEGSEIDVSMGDVSSSGIDEELLSDEEEIYALSLDKEASREEEKRLWQILKPHPKSESAPPKNDVKMESEDEGLFSRSNPRVKPVTRRKIVQDFQNWRNAVLPMADWELLGPETLSIDKEVNENHSVKRQKISDEEKPE
ncbi:hypothetical protein MGYG_02386 [Nannizzia gypsea CBS 118893]|uniref:Myb-like domain-containing protein n=1 Tax=Arthroderma gypseum (strain ATCC MYA-4604 / CBS 118893) TaxID=535722 RepID=E4URF3_ARTGP|nr:hypothetical protein MGYG_02386 [Nannizzia gypsea CBS 118893]EFQ99375.1 hypothetical protein MGYG_02386 [Nannizzia gypsea CBS 118893]